MKTRIAALTILCLALLSAPARAQQYDNGPINGTTDAWTINFGYVVSDTFVAPNHNPGSDLSLSFGVWEFPGDTLSSVDWSITYSENSPCPSDQCLANGTARGSQISDRFISSNQYSYNIDLITLTGLRVSTISGATYWLNLQNASVASGDPVYWDENSGAGCGGQNCPSSASESAIGTIPSEAFTVNAQFPEPSIVLLLGCNTVCLVAVLRRKGRHRA